ncbi:hypothetical protein [Aliikangiella coralliicola]|uniref:Lipoprotein n=1 Tax=Aliikangiella coralliicola TaxID=2592383 RepID=A0A545U0J2_9GAMM|nr:hypothetical protein [Aliikangiella coralliicola]TQV82986.1 hypothetical protein FLL46_24770 [Aliikangiella coralliicola]
MRSLTKKILGVLSALTACFCSNCFANDEQTSSSVFKPLTKELSFGGVEFSLVSSNDYYSQSRQANSSDKSVVFRPEISLFTTAKSAKSVHLSNGHSLAARSFGKSNRYKNTIPAVYRLTLKGYSIVEYSNYKTDTWTFNKVKDSALKKPQIMFSVTKQF